MAFAAQRPDPGLEPEELCSWKQIAHHLRVSIKTAQKWERERGLPVRRGPGERGRVYASPCELDTWLKLQDSGTLDRGEGPVRRRWGWAVAAVAVVVLSAAGWLLNRPAQPAEWRIEGRTLIVTDARGRELWTYALGTGRQFFDDRRKIKGTGIGPEFADLDGDGRPELLAPVADADGHAIQLMCLSPSGKLLWIHEPEEEARVPGSSYSGPWMVRSFAVVPRQDGPGQHVFTAWSHLTHYPALARLLDGRAGARIRDYWHSGHLVNGRVIDFGDGQGPLIYVAGISNSYRQATLLVLHPDRFGGASKEENPSYQILGQPEPVEVTRILFPRSRLNQRFERYNRALSMQKMDGRLQVEVVEHVDAKEIVNNAVIFYEFGPRGQLLKIDTGNGIPHFYNLLKDQLELPPDAWQAELADWPPLRFLTPWRDD